MREQIDGVLLFNKPVGVSSNQALQQVKRIFNAKKAGHTGTLDPLASGLLPICFGEATKFSSYLLEGNKEYLATIQLGVTTTTYDSEGEVVKVSPVTAGINEIELALSKFTGNLNQVPPIYSALKVSGKALYQYARANLPVEIKPRSIVIYHNELIKFIPDSQTIVINVSCSKGTYIRSLAHDIGEYLGCGASLTGLIRTKSNQFELNPQITLDYLSSLSQLAAKDSLLNVDVLVEHLPRLDLSANELTKIRVGNQFSAVTDYPLHTQFRVYFEGRFLGVVKLVLPETLQPSRLISVI
jgi:tRNA pseudouridine55 synthase